MKDSDDRRDEDVIYCEAPGCERLARWSGYRHVPGWYSLMNVCHEHKPMLMGFQAAVGTQQHRDGAA